MRSAKHNRESRVHSRPGSMESADQQHADKWDEHLSSAEESAAQAEG